MYHIFNTDKDFSKLHTSRPPSSAVEMTFLQRQRQIYKQSILCFDAVGFSDISI